eukprot:GFKZ01009126.1.p1 GENE.GFKZ01009126.1~~GFKZ01009126.1.p1  ORF type:complete len:326 (-),score=60.81 GFKZ01009126.1:985-1962(-)
MSSESGWCTIESDPGVFTELLVVIGVRNVQVEELYSLDRSLFPTHSKVHGLVFLFKYEKNSPEFPRAGTLVSPPPSSLFFANQSIQNACATQAILSIVMNTPDLEIGEELTRFREFTQGMDPVTKGMVVGNSEKIREAHNSFAPQEHLVFENNANTEKEDPFHFVAYIPHNNRVYELDGLQQGPLDLGEITAGSDWIDVVTPIISDRMEQYNRAESSEIRFNLMMVVEDPRERLLDEIASLEESDQNADKVASLRAEVLAQDEKHRRWQAENARRQWNFTPFMIRFVKALATTGHIEEVIKKATEKKKTAYQQLLQKESEGKATE